MKANFSNFIIFSLVILGGAVPAHADDFAKFKKLLDAPVSTYLDQEFNSNPNQKKPSFFKSSGFQDSMNRAFCPASSAVHGRIDLPQSEEILAAIKSAAEPYMNSDKFGPPKELIKRMSAEMDSDSRSQGDYSLDRSIIQGYRQERFTLPPMGGSSNSVSQDSFSSPIDPSDWQDRDGIRVRAKQTVADYFTHIPIFGSKIWSGSYDPPDPRHKHKHIYVGVNAQF